MVGGRGGCWDDDAHSILACMDSMSSMRGMAGAILSLLLFVFCGYYSVLLFCEMTPHSRSFLACVEITYHPRELWLLLLFLWEAG